MGKLLYGSPADEYDFDDRLLAHLRVVIVTKLRRGEGFTFTWDLSVAEGSGRVSLWMEPSIPLRFRFTGSREPQLNRAWVDSLAQVAASTVGLVPVPEPTSPKDE